MKPVFPLHIHYSDGEELVLETTEDVEVALEWFDSDDGDMTAAVVDDLGRPVRLKVERLRLITCELTTDAPSRIVPFVSPANAR
jgi:hypothetical protein